SAVSLINTVQSVMAVDLDRMAPAPTIDGIGTHGGYSGPAIKPLALRMVGEIARDGRTSGMPISGMGGISSWRDAAEFIALGAGTVQVCTAAMLHGFRIVEDMINGLSHWMDEKGYARIADFQGRAVPNFVDWEDLDLGWKTIAKIDRGLCIGCGLCHIACEDTSHQAIAASRENGTRVYEVIAAACVGCNLCDHVCPVEGCITMVPQPKTRPKLPWREHPNNPRRAAEPAGVV
ncbi:MAG: NAD-dependent dihydropyrimidine dehydrogenase subunit PreA, partial [Opitutaceae bacterium]|nr:NAD-dependent dihydropyrimidine dehydrogenase subunit PreA [Opitutaceae bacterium]